MPDISITSNYKIPNHPHYIIISMIVFIPACQQSILISIAIKMSDAKYHKIIVNDCCL